MDLTDTPLEDVSPGEELAAFQACMARIQELQAPVNKQIGETLAQAKALLERWATRCVANEDVRMLAQIRELQATVATMEQAAGER